MAYDGDLADPIRAVLQTEPRLTEKRMFGGLAFLIQGNLAVSASGQGGLLLRVDPAGAESLIAEPHVRRSRCAADKWTAGSVSMTREARTTRPTVERSAPAL